MSTSKITNPPSMRVMLSSINEQQLDYTLAQSPSVYGEIPFSVYSHLRPQSEITSDWQTRRTRISTDECKCIKRQKDDFD